MVQNKTIETVLYFVFTVFLPYLPRKAFIRDIQNVSIMLVFNFEKCFILYICFLMHPVRQFISERSISCRNRKVFHLISINFMTLLLFWF